MKKSIYAIIAMAFLSVAFTEAKAQPGYGAPGYGRYHESFYYYPNSNVYYSFRTNEYIYVNHDHWVVSRRLPRHIHLGRSPKVVVEHRGFDVWNDNRAHLAMYRDHRYNGYDGRRDGHFGATPPRY